MTLMNFVVFIIVGAIAGWLAGLIMKGRGFGVFGNIVIGIIGAFIGIFVFGLLKIMLSGVIGSILSATVGACLLLLAIRMIKK